ncbi:MAG: gas vesicle protein [Actinobacteria bacterium]|jgi:Gas vesicle protein G|nr:MAG: gas vesicle protein [Actinomycetota bacterium]
MGIFTGLLLLPLAPLRGTIWIAERLAEYAERELDDEATVRRLLAEAEIDLERGELTEEEFAHIEDELLERLDGAGLVPGEGV